MAIFWRRRRQRENVEFLRTVDAMRKQAMGGQQVVEVRGEGTKEASWPVRDIRSFAIDGFRKNIIVFFCVDLISDSVASVPLKLMRSVRDGEVQEVERHDLVTLLNRPNVLSRSREALMKDAVSYHQIAGNAYLEALRPMEGRLPRELWVKSPAKMKVLIGERSKNVVGYALVERPGEQGKEWLIDPRTGRSDILHVKTFHPLDDYYGMSPLEAAANNVDQHNEIDLWNWNVLSNGPAFRGVLETAKELKDSTLRRLTQAVREWLTGGDSAGEIPILQGGLTYKSTTFSPEQMAIVQNKTVTARLICNAFGVPPFLLGLPEGATFSNVAEAREYLWDTTVIPLTNHFVSELNEWLVPMYDNTGDLYFEPDYDSVPALEGRRKEKWDRVAGAEFLTLNEKRQALGFGPLEGGDELFLPINLAPLSFLADPGDGGGAEGDENEERSAHRALRLSRRTQRIRRLMRDEYEEELRLNGVSADTAKQLSQLVYSDDEEGNAA